MKNGYWVLGAVPVRLRLRYAAAFAGSNIEVNSEFQWLPRRDL